MKKWLTPTPILTQIVNFKESLKILIKYPLFPRVIAATYSLCIKIFVHIFVLENLEGFI